MELTAAGFSWTLKGPLYYRISDISLIVAPALSAMSGQTAAPWDMSPSLAPSRWAPWIADDGEKLRPDLGIFAKCTEHAAGDRADPGVSNATCGHALVSRLNDDTDAGRL